MKNNNNAKTNITEQVEIVVQNNDKKELQRSLDDILYAGFMFKSQGLKNLEANAEQMIETLKQLCKIENDRLRQRYLDLFLADAWYRRNKRLTKLLNDENATIQLLTHIKAPELSIYLKKNKRLRQVVDQSTQKISIPQSSDLQSNQKLSGYQRIQAINQAIQLDKNPKNRGVGYFADTVENLVNSCSSYNVNQELDKHLKQLFTSEPWYKQWRRASPIKLFKDLNKNQEQIMRIMASLSKLNSPELAGYCLKGLINQGQNQQKLLKTVCSNINNYSNNYQKLKKVLQDAYGNDSQMLNLLDEKEKKAILGKAPDDDTSQGKTAGSPEDLNGEPGRRSSRSSTASDVARPSDTSVMPDNLEQYSNKTQDVNHPEQQEAPNNSDEIAGLTDETTNDSDLPREVQQNGFNRDRTQSKIDGFSLLSIGDDTLSNGQDQSKCDTDQNQCENDQYQSTIQKVSEAEDLGKLVGLINTINSLINQDQHNATLTAKQSNELTQCLENKMQQLAQQANLNPDCPDQRVSFSKRAKSYALQRLNHALQAWQEQKPYTIQSQQMADRSQNSQIKPANPTSRQTQSHKNQRYQASKVLSKYRGLTTYQTESPKKRRYVEAMPAIEESCHEEDDAELLNKGRSKR